MIALVAVETAVLLLLVVLVVALLRSHAVILRRLHELGGGLYDDVGDGTAQPVPFRTRADVLAPPPGRATGDPAHDLSGSGLREAAVALRVTGVAHDTLLAFLSSGCTTCGRFWDDFASDQPMRLPPNTRLVIVAKDPAEESPAALAALAPPGIELVQSSRAWLDYRVPGSPYFVFVEGSSGRVRGEGTGLSWEQVANLLAQATGDLGFVTGGAPGRRPNAASDAVREAHIDAELMAAGVFPGDPSLYPGEGTMPGHPATTAESPPASSPPPAAPPPLATPPPAGPSATPSTDPSSPPSDPSSSSAQ